MVISGVRCFGLSVLSRSRVERLGRDGYGCSYLYRQIWPKDQEFPEKIPEMELGLWVHSSTGDYEMDVIRCTWRIRGGREQRAGGVPIMGDMTKVEVAELYRSGGRGAHEARELKLTPGFVATAEGSVLIEVGHTRVLCNATVENGVPGWMRNSGRGWVTAEYGMLPRATLTRSPREAEKGKIGGRTHEIQRLIGRSLRSVVDMKLLGERTVILDCDVLQADGGTRTAAITGACTALALALGKLVEAGTSEGVSAAGDGGGYECGSGGWAGAAGSGVRGGLARGGGYERGDDVAAAGWWRRRLPRRKGRTRGSSWTRCWMWRRPGFANCWRRRSLAWRVENERGGAGCECGAMISFCGWRRVYGVPSF